MERECSGREGSRRPQDHNKPYSRRRSMMGRMKDTVKDMLSPSWLVDLVHSVKKKTPPPSPSLAHHNNNTVADSCFMSPPQSGSLAAAVAAPPGALGRSTIFVPIQQGVEQNENCSLSNSCAVRRTAVPFSSEAMSQYKSSTLPLVNGADVQCELDTYAVPMTSSSSSRQPTLHSANVMQIRHDLSGSVSPSKQIDPPVAQPSTSADSGADNRAWSSDQSYLWSSDSSVRRNQPQHSARSNKPAFNVSVFGTPTQRGSLTSEGSRLPPLGTGYQSSPFYPGKTAFGGAATHRRARLQNSSPYRVMSKKQVVARPLNVSHTGGVTSSTAKRILDTLEKMSSPLNDAKKIPSYHSSVADSPLSFTPSVYRRRSMPNRGAAGRINLDAPPTQGLSTPSFATRTHNLQQTPVSRSDHPAAVSNDPSVSAACNVRVAEDRVVRATTTTGGKMKRDRGKHYSSHRPEEEQVEIPDLPTTLSLPIKELPTFNFTTAATTTATASVSQTVLSPTFKFSSPVSPMSPLMSNSDTVMQTFEFSSPIAMKSDGSSLNGIAVAPSVAAATTSLAFSYTPTATAKLKKRPTAMTGSEASTSEATATSPNKTSSNSQLKAGSVMDFLTKTSPVKSTVNCTSSESKAEKKCTTGGSLSELFSKPVGSWTCSTCLVQNTANASACVACQTANTQLNTASSNTDTSCSLSSLFHKPAGSWECPTCMIQNKSTAVTCVSCATSQPASKHITINNNSLHKPLVEDTGGGGGGSLSSLFRKPAGSWECSVCMITNSATAQKCVACSNVKPAQNTPLIQSAESVTTPQSSTAVTSLAAQMRKPTGSWECDTCMVTNQPDANKCIACDTPKTGATTTTSFKSAGGFQQNADTSTGGVKMAEGGGFTFTVIPTTDLTNTTTTTSPPFGGTFGGTFGTQSASTDTAAKHIQFGSFANASTASKTTVVPIAGFKPPQVDALKFGSFPAAAAPVVTSKSLAIVTDPKASQSATFAFSPLTTTAAITTTVTTANCIGSGGFKLTDTTVSTTSVQKAPTFSFGAQNAPLMSKGGALGANSATLGGVNSTPAPLATPSSGVSAGGFQFVPTTTSAVSNPAFSCAAPSTGGFTFGATPAATTTPTVAAAFMFGTSTSAGSFGTSTSAGSFGTSTSAGSFGTTTASSTTTAGFKFGAGTATGTSGTTAGGGAFSFGKRAIGETEDVPTKRKATGLTFPSVTPTVHNASTFAAPPTAANFGTTPTPAFGAPTPSFGAAPTPAFGAPTPAFVAPTAAAPNPAPFQFGATSQNPPGGFQFGAQPAVTSAAVAPHGFSGGFTFGQSTPAPTSNFNFSATTPANFNFTGSAQPPAQAPSTFQFGAQPPNQQQPQPGSNPFVPSHTTQGYRPKKKAVRKLKK